MGKKTVRFKCLSCRHCCRDVICLPTPADVVQIVKATRLHPEEFLTFITPEDIEDVEADDPTWIECQGERYLMAMKRGPKKRGCYFLDRKTALCTIYEARPLLCRLYPFKLQETREGDFKGFTLHKDVECPRCKDGEMDCPPLHAIYLQDSLHQDDYATLVKIFNRRTDPLKKPEDFIRLFVEVRVKKRKSR